MSEGAYALEGLDEKTPKLSKMSGTGQHQIPPPSPSSELTQSIGPSSSQISNEYLQT